MSNYYVIGGQYFFHCYGCANTIRGAKLLATKHEEYWDNWQGWHTPSIYREEDCTVLEDGRVVPFRGQDEPIISYPLAWKTDGKWHMREEG